MADSLRRRGEPTAARPAPRNGFDRFFDISARGSTLSREIRGGLATFFTMAYIVVLNPLILGSGVDSTGGKLADRRRRLGDGARRRAS